MGFIYEARRLRLRLLLSQAKRTLAFAETSGFFSTGRRRDLRNNPIVITPPWLTPPSPDAITAITKQKELLGMQEELRQMYLQRELHQRLLHCRRQPPKPMKHTFLYPPLLTVTVSILLDMPKTATPAAPAAEQPDSKPTTAEPTCRPASPQTFIVTMSDYGERTPVASALSAQLHANGGQQPQLGNTLTGGGAALMEWRPPLGSQLPTPCVSFPPGIRRSRVPPAGLRPVLSVPEGGSVGGSGAETYATAIATVTTTAKKGFSLLQFLPWMNVVASRTVPASSVGSTSPADDDTQRYEVMATWMLGPLFTSADSIAASVPSEDPQGARQRAPRRRATVPPEGLPPLRPAIPAAREEAVPAVGTRQEGRRSAPVALPRSDCKMKPQREDPEERGDYMKELRLAWGLGAAALKEHQLRHHGEYYCMCSDKRWHQEIDSE